MSTGTVNNVTIAIRGMSCNHCVMAVRQEIEKLPGVESCDVKIGSASVRFDDGLIDATRIAAAIREAGYEPLT